MWWTAVVRPGQRPVTTWVYKPEAANSVWSSWWWAICRSKHVEPSVNFGIINSITRLHLVGYFYWLLLRRSNINDRNCNTWFGFTYSCRVCVFKDLEDGGGIPPNVNLNWTCAFLVVCGCPVVLFGCVSRITLRRDVSNVDGGCFDYCGKYVDWRDV